MNKKGFTLIELLAVIVILAIIALIATPIILNVIEDSKKGTYKTSALNIIRAGELHLAENLENAEGLEILDLATEKKLSYSGKRPDVGFLLINESGESQIAIIMDSWCVSKRFNEPEPVITKENDTERPECQTMLGGFPPAKTYIGDGTDTAGLYINAESSLEYESVYKGSAADNFMVFGGQCFRIINVGREESDYSAKIVYHSELDNSGKCKTLSEPITERSFDASGIQKWNETSSDSIRADFENWFSNATSTKLYDKLILSTKEKNNVKQHTFNVGGTYHMDDSNATTTVLSQKELEDDETYLGYVGLLASSDHIASSTDESPLSGRCSVKQSFYGGCGQGSNYTTVQYSYFTMNYTLTNTSKVAAIETMGRVYSETATALKGVRPVFYLTAETEIIGMGTITYPFRIR